MTIQAPRGLREWPRAGCKFSFGTNNAGADDLGRQYGLR
jgi:hypothetical protein